MSWIRTAVREPIAVLAICGLVTLFGALALTRLPLQLFPDIERPQMSLRTEWPGASPSEVEREIVRPQEEALEGLPGLAEIEAFANSGGSWVNLQFEVGTEPQAMLLEVLARLNRLPAPPDGSRPPQITAGGNDSNQTLSFFFVQLKPGTPGRIEDQRRFVEDVVVPRLRVIPGLAAVEINGLAQPILKVRFDPAKAAALGISIGDLADAARPRAGSSGGTIAVDRRDYSLSITGSDTPEAIGNAVLAWRDGRAVLLKEVAEVQYDYAKRAQVVWQNGNPALGLRLIRRSGANVLATLEQVHSEVAALRAGPLAERGLDIAQSFDPGVFILRAVQLLSGNLGAGVLLAVGCLWWFLRDRRATALVALAIPISLAATMIVLAAAGRSLNVISLAGLAFAVGMVMDAAIVVVENILRLRALGMSPERAAERGSREVCGALLASTATTLAVFAPVPLLQDAEGQLFSDLALTVSVSVMASLAVAVFLLPAIASKVLSGKDLALSTTPYPRLRPWLLQQSTGRRGLLWSLALTAGVLLTGALMLPALDYLPPVKRAAIDGGFQFPPGMSVERADREIGSVVRERLAPFMDGTREPRLLNWYQWFWNGGGTIGVRAADPSRIGELEQIVQKEILKDLPDTRAFAGEGDLFGGQRGSGRAIELNLSGPDLAVLEAAATRVRTSLEAQFPESRVQLIPEPNAGAPELKFASDSQRMAELGVRQGDLTMLLRALGDGAYLGQQFDGQTRRDVRLSAEVPASPEAIQAMRLSTPAGSVSLGELVQVQSQPAATQLRRLDGRRALTLSFDPPAEMALETALAALEKDLLPQLRRELGEGYEVAIAGSADRLAKLLTMLMWHISIVCLVLTMLMWALFKKIGDALIVLATLPLAFFGGVLGLRALSLFAFQPLDLLSMIGFVLLIGMVLNNAILLIAQTRALETEGLPLTQAIGGAIDQRLRPILIGALTGVVGALPMAINPGPGAVIYRGLAAVCVGGTAFSLVFVLVLVPALLIQVARFEAFIGRVRASRAASQTLSSATPVEA